MFTIGYFSDAVVAATLAQPDTIAARYVVLTRRLETIGPNLGEPHTKAMGMACLNCVSKALKA